MLGVQVLPRTLRFAFRGNDGRIEYVDLLLQHEIPTCDQLFDYIVVLTIEETEKS